MSRCVRRTSVRLLRERCWRRITSVDLTRWSLFRRWPEHLSVAVLVVDGARRRTLERQIRVTLRRLKRVLGTAFPSDAAVIVQQIVVTQCQLAGCYHIGHRADGSRFVLIRLALQVDGQALTSEEVLAVLAEQCIALALQSCSPTLLVPIDLDPAQPADAHHPTGLRPDPLASLRDLTDRSA